MVSKTSVNSDTESLASCNGDVCEECTTVKQAADKFPKLKLQTYLACRDKFAEADANRDGVSEL